MDKCFKNNEEGLKEYSNDIEKLAKKAIEIGQKHTVKINCVLGHIGVVTNELWNDDDSIHCEEDK